MSAVPRWSEATRTANVSALANRTAVLAGGVVAAAEETLPDRWESPTLLSCGDRLLGDYRIQVSKG